jgi:hypothetical protein
MLPRMVRGKATRAQTPTQTAIALRGTARVERYAAAMALSTANVAAIGAEKSDAVSSTLRIQLGPPNIL